MMIPVGLTSPSSVSSSTLRCTCGFSLDSKPDSRELSDLSNKMDLCSKYSNVPCKPETIGSALGSCLISEGNLKESLKTTDPGSVNYNLKGAFISVPFHRVIWTYSIVVDLLESDQDYVLVSGPTMESSSEHASKTSYLASKSGSPPLKSGHINSTPSASLSIIGAPTDIVDHIGLESHSSAPGTLQGSINIVDTSELSSTDCMTRIKSFQSCASATISD